MTAIEFRDAVEEDDSKLRQLLMHSGLAGNINISLTREPSYFSGLSVLGQPARTMVVSHRESQKLLGMGVIGLRRCYVNRQPVSLGYLSNLRLLPNRENLKVIRQAYAFLKTWARDNGINLFLQCVTAGNQKARAFLALGRFHLPRVTMAYNLYTYFFNPTLYSKINGDSSLYIRRASDEDLPHIFKFIEENHNRQFFPAYSISDFTSGRHGLLTGLSSNDIRLAFEKRKLVGILGTWDQRSYKQTVINRYRFPLNWSRQTVNLFHRIQNKPLLPRQGRSLEYVSAALCCIKNDRLPVFGSLLKESLKGCRYRKNCSFSIMVSEPDPFFPFLNSLSGYRYGSVLQSCCYPDLPVPFSPNKTQAPYMELGGL